MTDNVKPKESEDTEAADPASNAETEVVTTGPAAKRDESERTITENTGTAEPDDIEGDEPVSTYDASSANSDLVEERNEYRDLIQKLKAEFDNYRKKTEGERQRQSERATVQLITEILPVLDDFERALKTATNNGQSDAFRIGIEQIYRKLTDILRKRGVTPIESVGKIFDPNFHEAVAHEESNIHEDGEIIDELRRGYMVGSVLLRASMVRVAKA